MPQQNASGKARQRPAPKTNQEQLSLEHYAQVIFHRKWLVVATFLVCTAGTAVFSSRLTDVYSSETVILVDPQKVPDVYVKATVTGDIRNRLGTLSQQILSVTRLQKIIDNLNLYAEERKTMTREEVITRMRRDTSVNVLSEFGGTQDLQAFKISYSGREPRLVAQVTNELASLFIEENLKARELQATGTTEFLQNQLVETRKTLELEEGKLRDYKLRHIGELPEQQSADLQILGQLQSQLQLASDALGRSEQQKNYIQTMMAAQTNSAVVDLDETEIKRPKSVDTPTAQPSAPSAKSRLASLLSRYSDDHPDVKRLKRQIADEESRHAKEPVAPVAAASVPPPPSAQPVRKPAPPAVRYANPVLESQLKALEGEIAKHREEQQRITKQVSSYQAKLEAIPVREQEMTQLVRDYEISKAHYKQLLEKQLSAETATQLEIRQKGERFSVLDPAQAASRPSKPNRQLINAAGACVGLVLGLVLALMTELLGMSITSPEQIVAATGLTVLEVIPIIYTQKDRISRKRRLVLAAASAAVVAVGCCAMIFFQYRSRFF